MTDTSTILPGNTPEQADVDRRVALINPDWVSPELLATLTRRASVRALHRELEERRTETETRISQLTGDALIGVYPPDAAVDKLVALQSRAAALPIVAASLPDPLELDWLAVTAALLQAGTALQAVTLHVEQLAYVSELEAWRLAQETTKRTFDPPINTDAERAIAEARDELAERCATWHTHIDTWAADVDAMGPGHEPTDFLASATENLRRAADLAGEVQAMNDKVRALNAARADAGLTWSAGTHGARLYVA